MSINIAISNAYSGVSANSRLAEIVSRNIANASVDGYAARIGNLSSRVIDQVGGGVKVDVPTRSGDAFVTADRRRADARAGGEALLAQASRALSDLVEPEGGDITLAVAWRELDSALRGLAATPESENAQVDAVDAARTVAETLSGVSSDARRMRVDADAEIARKVEQVNAALQRIDALNREIRKSVATGRDPTALQDERDRQVEIVNAIVPIRATPRPEGGIALISQGGAVLLDETAQQISFTATPGFDETTTLASGGLSGLTVYGQNATPTGDDASRLLAGGELEALFRIRDEVVPQFTAQLDAMARDLVERFQDPAVDTTLAAGDAGLFVDGGGGGPAVDFVADPSQQVGLARRLAVNAAVDPEQGGAAWRMRDGINAATASTDAADATLPVALSDAFAAARTPAGPVSADAPYAAIDSSGFTQARSATALIETVVALRETSAALAEQTAVFSRAAAETLTEAELRTTAVDTDAELRDLLAIEKAYAANAQVISVVDGLLEILLEI